MILIAGIMMVGLTGCDFKTPEIRGVVLDAATKQPVEGAWIRATLQIKTKTIQGNVQSVLRVEPPHTRSDNKGAFVKALQKLVPEITKDDLEKGGAGVRAQAIDKHGKLMDDFVIDIKNKIINVLNAPSPAATSSLAIGEKISEEIINRLN